VLLFAGKVATTYFYSTSGGRTESSADWTGTAVPYLVSVTDPYDALSPYHDWGPVPVTAQALLKALKTTGPVTDVATTPNPAGRVAQLTVATPAQSLAVPATKLRTAIGLRSTWFTVGLLSLTPPQPAAPVTYGQTVTLSSVVRGLQGVTLEQRPSGGDWQPVRAVAGGAGTVSAAPTVTTDYRLATSAVAAGSVKVRVAPAVTLAAASTAEVDGSVAPVLPGAAVELQQRNGDLIWTSVTTGVVAADGTFALPVALVPGATVRVVVTPGAGYAPGLSSPQAVSG
jgi:hypothetical protein